MNIPVRTHPWGVGSGWADVVHAEDHDRTFAAWNTALQVGKPFEIEHRLRGADGGFRWFLTRAVPICDPFTARIIRWLGTRTDISEIIAAREAAARSAAELETLVAERTRALSDAAQELAAEIRRREAAQAALLQSHKLEALGQLTGGVAHDFNNVLATIVGGYGLIRRRTDSEAILKLVGLGERAAERASHLTRQLLTFARRNELRPTILELVTVLQGADDLICHALGSNVQCVTEVAADVWPVLADLHQLEVALLNLAVNARDAMPDGGTVTIAARNLGPAERPSGLPVRDYVAIAVRDTGQGMPPDLVARVTEPFFTTKPPRQGTGLGLSMVHGFAGQSSGGLRIKSQPGAGTTVEIILPRAAVTGMDASDIAASVAVDPTLHGNAVILLVEDDEQVRPMTAGLLRDLGYTVIEAASAEAASALVHTLEHLDLVITDVVMPGADGPTFAARLRAERPALPMLFVTGYAGDSVLDGETVLRKPFTGAGLAAAVLERLDRHIPPDTVRLPSDRLLARLRKPALRELYLAWRAARRGSDLPRLEDIDPARFGLGENAFTVVVDATADPPFFCFANVGEALTARLGRSMHGDSISVEPASEDVLGSLEAAFRRCARERKPTYEAARYDFGDGAPMYFDRLVLPMSMQEQTITHLVGVALFGGPTA